NLVRGRAQNDRWRRERQPTREHADRRHAIAADRAAAVAKARLDRRGHDAHWRGLQYLWRRVAVHLAAGASLAWTEGFAPSFQVCLLFGGRLAADQGIAVRKPPETRDHPEVPLGVGVKALDR